MLITSILLGLFVIFLAYFIISVVITRRARPVLKLPPCPGWTPLIGSIRHIENPLPIFLSKKYTKEDIVLLYFGSQKVFYLNTLKAAKEAYLSLGENFSYRPIEIFNEVNYGESGGIVMMDGEVWKEYRRFTLKTLKDFGFGKNLTEESIIEEISYLREIIDSNLGKPLDSANLLSKTVSNVICKFLFGCRLASEDEEFNQLLDAFASLLQEKDHTQDLLIQSLIRGIFGNNGRAVYSVIKFIPEAKRVFTDFYQILAYCDVQKESHRARFDRNGVAKDYIEAHFHHMIELQQQPSEEKSIFSEKRMTLAMVDLFLAGTDTTASTLRWAFLFAQMFPEAMEKAEAEVLREIGSERMPSMKDKKNCNYVQAFIEETHRCAALVPLTIVHRSHDDVQVCGYDIPKDSYTFINVYSIHYNPEVFPEPYKFKPERYLDAEGNFFHHEHVIPFGMGKRSCLGESLAVMELFLFFTSFLQRYKVRISGANLQELIDKPTLGDVRAPKNYDIIFELRK